MTQDRGDNTFHNADNCDCVRCNPELVPGRFCVSIDIFDNLTHEMIFEDGFNCEKPAGVIRALELAIARLRETVA